MVRFRCWSTLAILMAAVSRADAQVSEPHELTDGYYPAFCSSAAFPSPTFRLVIFREKKRESSVEVPLGFDLLNYSPDGSALYVLSKTKHDRSNTPSLHSACISRISLNPIQIGRPFCVPGLGAVFAFTTSADGQRMIVSGQIKDDHGARCGVFAIRLLDGATRQILSAEDKTACKTENSWISISMSPSADLAVAVRHNRLELLNFTQRTTTAIADGILRAAWSPDGNWIAAVRLRGGTQLISAANLQTKRTLADSLGEWSPDSRFLLGFKACFFPIAVNGVGTLTALDIATGKSITFANSRCKVTAPGTAGWVSMAANH